MRCLLTSCLLPATPQTCAGSRCSSPATRRLQAEAAAPQTRSPRSVVRLFWIVLRRFWDRWSEALVIVQPETLDLGSHRLWNPGMKGERSVGWPFSTTTTKSSPPSPAGDYALPPFHQLLTYLRSSRVMALNGLRMMPLSPSPSLKFRTARFPGYGFKADISDGAFPSITLLKLAPSMRRPVSSLPPSFASVRVRP